MAEYKSIYTGEQIDAAIGKANTALQTELEPSFNASASKNITSEDITNWNNKSEFSGSYNDLTNKPTIPSDTSDLTNGAGFITNAVDNLTNYYKKNETYTQTEIDSKLSSVYKYRGTVATYNDLPSTGLIIGDVYNIEQADSTHGIKAGDNVAWNGLTWDVLAGMIDISGKEDISNKVTTINGSSTDTQYPSAKAIYDKLISGAYNVYNLSFSTSNPFVFDGKKKGIYFPNMATITNVNGNNFYYKKQADTGSYSTLKGFPFYVKIDIDVDWATMPDNTDFGSICTILDSGNLLTGILTKKSTPIYQVSKLTLILNSGNQSISGVKTFSSIPKQSNTTAPTNDAEFTNKKYVDDSIASAITTTLNGSY